MYCGHDRANKTSVRLPSFVDKNGIRGDWGPWGGPKNGCVLHNNTVHHGTNIDNFLCCISVWGMG